MKFEEKKTDVTLATEMLRDAYTTDVRAFALISGDSDFTVGTTPRKWRERCQSA